MTNKKLQPTLIGVFVICSLLLFMAAIVIFGGARFFDKQKLVITYFEGSMQGLNVGAPVTYRGVSIGQVKEIKIHIRSNGTRNEKLIIPVIISLNAGKTLIINETDDKNIDVFLKSLCDQGLRAKMKTQSLVTGKLYIDLDFYKNSPPVYRDNRKKHFEIPTLPSEMYQFGKMLEDMNLRDLSHKIVHIITSVDHLTDGLAQSLTKEKTEKVMDELTAAMTSLQSILHKVESDVPSILEEVDSFLDHLNILTINAEQLVTTVDDQVAPLAHNLDKTLGSIDTTLQQVDTFLVQANKTIHPGSPLYYRITEAMGQLEQTAKSIENLSDFLYRNPDTLIFGLQQTGETPNE